MSIRLRHLRGWLCFVLLAATAGAVAGAQDKWLRVTTAEFTLVTTLKEKEAVEWAANFSQFVNALSQFIPVKTARLPRLTLVVFARDRDFLPYRPLDAAGKPKAVAGYFSRRESWAVAGMGGSALGEETRRIIFHEGTHWFLSAFELPNPVWLEEGLAEVFSTFLVETKTYTWGMPLNSHLGFMADHTLMPVERLMFLSSTDLFGAGDDGELKTGLAYAESWAFLHYLIFGQSDVPLTALTDYVKLYRTAINPDDAFRQAFGMTYSAMDQKLAAYIRSGTYRRRKSPKAVLPAPEVKLATPFEVEDALGRLSLAAGRGPEALAHAQKALAIDADSPLGFELLGQIYDEAKQEEKATAAYREAVQRGTRDFRPYFEIARSEQGAAKEWDGSVRSLAPEDARRIVNLYERSINLNPRFVNSYQSMAGLVELVPTGNPSDREFLELGKKLYPDDGMIRLGLAVLLKKEGREDEAKAMLESAVSGPQPAPPHVSSYAARLENAWQQRAIADQLKGLLEEKKYAEALALVNAQLPLTSDVNFHRYLTSTRTQLVTNTRFMEMREAWDDRRWVDARRILNEIIESDAPAAARNQARQNLTELDRRRLGMPK